MKRTGMILFVLAAFSFIIPPLTVADCRGCCSGHGGVVCANGVTKCADGTNLSAACQQKNCNMCVRTRETSINKNPSKTEIRTKTSTRKGDSASNSKKTDISNKTNRQ